MVERGRDGERVMPFTCACHAIVPLLCLHCLPHRSCGATAAESPVSQGRVTIINPPPFFSSPGLRRVPGRHGVQQRGPGLRARHGAPAGESKNGVKRRRAHCVPVLSQPPPPFPPPSSPRAASTTSPTASATPSCCPTSKRSTRPPCRTCFATSRRRWAWT